MYVYILYNFILLKVFFKTLAPVLKKLTVRTNRLKMVQFLKILVYPFRIP